MAADPGFIPELEVQFATACEDIPSEEDFHTWVVAALQSVNQPAELVIRLVDEEESRQLNAQYRGKDKPTNVLSFPFEAPSCVESGHLGDLVICVPVVRREALEQHKKEADHWAHMVVHGVLHLRGYDHQNDTQAQAMETLERKILATLGVRDPYQVTHLAV